MRGMQIVCKRGGQREEQGQQLRRATEQPTYGAGQF